MNTTSAPPRASFNRVLTAKEAEQALRLSKNTVNALLQSGRLRSVRVGRKYLIPEEAIEEFLRGER